MELAVDLLLGDASRLSFGGRHLGQCLAYQPLQHRTLLSSHKNTALFWRVTRQPVMSTRPKGDRASMCRHLRIVAGRGTEQRISEVQVGRLRHAPFVLLTGGHSPHKRVQGACIGCRGGKPQSTPLTKVSLRLMQGASALPKRELATVLASTVPPLRLTGSPVWISTARP